MIPSRLLPMLFAVVVPLSAMSCDSNTDPKETDDPFTQADFPLCDAHTTHVVGTVDGQSIDVTLDPGGLSQDNTGGDFQIQGHLTPDPAEADLRLSWDHLTPTKVAIDATGTLHLIDGPFAGETFCAGAGTKIRMPGDGTTIQFDLNGLASGDSCGVARTGRLRGCSR